MVFALFVFTSLVFVTICIFATDPAPVSTAVSAVREVFTGNCRLNCRRNHTEAKGPLTQNLPNVTQTTGLISQTSKTFKQAIELTNEHLDLHNPEQSPGSTNANVSANGTKITPSASTPYPASVVAAPFSQTQSENFCVCETCACALIENLFNKTKPAENVYNDFKEAIFNSQMITTLINVYTRLANSYPATIEYLEEDKIDSEENFFFRKSAEGLPLKATAVNKNVDINKRLSNNPPKSITPIVTSSTSNLQNPLTNPTPSHSKTPPAIKPILHNEKDIETPGSGGLTIREKEAPTATLQITPDSIPERKPQSIASIEREIQEFISSGPPPQPPLYTCPSCQSKGLVCVRGCPKESIEKSKDQK